MKKYFLYELKRNRLPAVIITVFSIVLYLLPVAVVDFRMEVSEWGVYMPPSFIQIPLVTLMVLCTLVPILMFAFKMDSKQVDCLYSMSIKREKLYLVKSIVGLLMVLVPYTLAFWLGFTVTAIKPNDFVLSGFVTAYFVSIPFAVLLFGFNAFAFSRANRIIDGLIFIALYACAAVFAILYFYFIRYHYYNAGGAFFGQSPFDFQNWFSYSPLAYLLNRQNNIIRRSLFLDHEYRWVMYLYAIITGIAAWAGLFATARLEKAENTERVSSAKFGYSWLIPFYFAIALSFGGAMRSRTEQVIYSVLCILAAIVAYIIYRRSFKLKKVDWYSMLGAFVAGIILSVILIALY